MEQLKSLKQKTHETSPVKKAGQAMIKRIIKHSRQ